MQVSANGRSFEVPEGIGLVAFIRSRELDPALVIVERNGEPVLRADYERVVLSDGDRLELVRAVAGGAR